MRVLYSPTVNDDFKYEYTFNKETIKAELYEISMIDEAIDETLVDTKIYDLSNVEADKEYTSLPEFIVEVNRAEDESLEIEVVSYVISSETDEKALFPEWVEVEEHEFDARDSEVLEEIPAIQHKVDNEKELLQAQVDILVEEAEFKDDLLQQLILEVYSTK